MIIGHLTEILTFIIKFFKKSFFSLTLNW